jgi:hypothetical protein
MKLIAAIAGATNLQCIFALLCAMMSLSRAPSPQAGLMLSHIDECV